MVLPANRTSTGISTDRSRRASASAVRVPRGSVRRCRPGPRRRGSLPRSSPVARLVELAQGAVVEVLSGVGDDGDTLAGKGVVREFACLWAPTRHAVPPGFFVSGVSMPSTLMRSRPLVSSTTSTVSPSTMRSTAAVVVVRVMSGLACEAEHAVLVLPSTAAVSAAAVMPARAVKDLLAAPVMAGARSAPRRAARDATC